MVRSSGLRLARNAVVLGAVLATEAEGMKFPLTFPIDFGPIVWVTHDRLTSQGQPKGKPPQTLRRCGRRMKLTSRDKNFGCLRHGPLSGSMRSVRAAWFPDPFGQPMSQTVARGKPSAAIPADLAPTRLVVGEEPPKWTCPECGPRSLRGR